MKYSKESKEITLLSLSKILALIIGIVSAAILSRVRSLEEYGTYSQMLTAVTIVTSILMLGLPNSINFYLSRHDDTKERNHFISVFYTLNTILSLLAGLVLVVIMPLIATYYKNPLIKSFVYFLAVCPWTRIIIATIERLLIQYGQSRYVLVYNLSHNGAILAINAIVAAGGMGFSAYMAMYTVVQVIFAFIVYIIAAKNGGGLHFVIDRSLVREILVFSIPLGLSSVIGTLNIELDKLVIGRLMDPQAVAIYANAGKEMPVTFLSAAINAVMLPKITRLIKNKETEKAVSIWGNSAYVSFAFICIASFGFIAFAPQVLTLFYSSKYLPGVGIFRIYCIELLLRCTYIGMILNATGDTKKILYCSIGTLIINLICNILFFYLIGFIGPAISTVFSAFVMNALQLKMTSIKTGISFRKVMPWKKLLYIIALNAGLFAVFFFAQDFLPLEKYIGEIGEAIILGVFWCAVYISILGKKMLSLWKNLGEQ